MKIFKNRCNSLGLPTRPEELCVYAPLLELWWEVWISNVTTCPPTPPPKPKRNANSRIFSSSFACGPVISPARRHTPPRTRAVMNVGFTSPSSPPPGSLYSREGFVLMLCFPSRIQGFTKVHWTAGDPPKIPARSTHTVTLAAQAWSACPAPNLPQGNEGLLTPAVTWLSGGGMLLPPTYPGPRLTALWSNRISNGHRAQDQLLGKSNHSDFSKCDGWFLANESRNASGLGVRVSGRRRYGDLGLGAGSDTPRKEVLDEGYKLRSEEWETKRTNGR